MRVRVWPTSACVCHRSALPRAQLVEVLYAQLGAAHQNAALAGDRANRSSSTQSVGSNRPRTDGHDGTRCGPDERASAGRACRQRTRTYWARTDSLEMGVRWRSIDGGDTGCRGSATRHDIRKGGHRVHGRPTVECTGWKTEARAQATGCWQVRVQFAQDISG